jgi:sigma-B regulation protein RsbU (phosphoserine phosphatase)
VAYTDGISEAANSADEEWGEERLAEVIQHCDGLPAQEILQCILAAADTFVAGAAQRDDMTLVVLRVVPSSQQ